MPKNIAFCFIEGEPTLYIKDKGIYHTLYYDYDEILNIMKKEIIENNLKNRPTMNQIWKLLISQFPCISSYYSKLNRKTHVNPDSFESRFSKDISVFLDTLFKRGLSAEEKEALELAKLKRRQEMEVKESIIESHYKIIKRMKNRR